MSVDSIAMKSLWSHLLVALVASFTSFLLFRAYYPIPSTAVVSDSAVVSPIIDRGQQLIKDDRLRSFNHTKDFSLIVNRVVPAVVNITGLSATNYRVSSGSGVIVSPEGYIVTNHHVIEDATTLRITLYNKRKYDAEVIGMDTQTDLALIKINSPNLSTLPMGNSNQLDVGEWVLAIGHPFNLTSTVTAGIVSAKARNINILGDEYSIESFIQTDAVVNPGNSGGALINAEGQLVGINTAILTKSGVSEGYSFAIPSNLVRKVITDLRAYGQVQRAILGVNIFDVTDEIAFELGLSQVEGVFIQSVTPGGTAFHAGLTKGDVILKVNDIPTATVPELQEQVALYRPGDSISLVYMRNGKIKRIENMVLSPLKRMRSDRK